MIFVKRAEAQLAACWLNLSQRLLAHDLSASSPVLNMEREEMCSPLGSKLETVSRTFSRFREHGLLEG